MAQMAKQKTQDQKARGSIPGRGEKKCKIFYLVFSWLLLVYAVFVCLKNINTPFDSDSPI